MLILNIREFVMLLEDLEHEDEATTVAQRLLDNLLPPFRAQGRDVCRRKERGQKRRLAKPTRAAETIIASASGSLTPE